MSSLAGWRGHCAGGESILQRMVEVMNGPAPTTERHLTDDFAAATTQPAAAADMERIVSSDDGQVTVVFAGYLYTEDTGERSAPARHCLALYLARGLTFAEALNGSFVIAILDRRTGRLHLVTDRLATRALYYCRNDPFLFAGEVKAILEFPGVSRKLSPNQLIEFLVRERLLCCDSHYDAVLRVPEASVLTWDGAKVSTTTYWRPPFDTEKCWDIRENARRAYAALRNATRRVCSSAERPGLMLSGGLDSRAVAVSSAVAPLCFTMHTTPGYEVQTARRVAGALGYEHEFFQLPASYPFALLTDGSLIGDGQCSFHHAQGLYLADRLRERGIDCLMNAWLLEILFAGRLLPTRTWKGLGLTWKLPVLQPESRFDNPTEVLTCLLTADLPKLRRVVTAERLDEVLSAARDRIGRWLSGLDADGASQYDLNSFVYLANMSCGRSFLNIRAIDRLVPAGLVIADTELVDLFFSIPAEHRFCHRLYSCMLTQVDRRCRWVPYSNTGVPVSRVTLLEHLGGRLHRKALRRVSSGLTRLWRGRDGKTEWSSWPRFSRPMREQPEWREYLRARAASPRLADMGVVSADAIRGIVDDQIAGRDNSPSLIGTWLTLEEWLARYG